MVKKFKIAFICKKFPTISETFIRNQIDYFIEQGHEVSIIATGHLKDNALLRKYKNVYGMKSNFQKLYLFPFFFILSFLKNPLFTLKSLNFFKYWREAFYLKIFYPYIFSKDKKYDILMCHFGDSGVVGSFIKKEFMKDSKLFCMFHGFDIRKGIKKKGKIYTQLFKQADGIFSISHYNYYYLKKWGAKNIINHPVGIDTQKYKIKNKRIKNDKIKILTIGRLVKEKGYFYAIDAVSKLIKDNPEKLIEYNIVGDGYLKKEIRDYIKKKKLEKIIFLHGEKEGEEILEFYKNSDIFLLTSVNEALPVVIMEAQSYELPVVVTDVGSVKEEIIQGKSGFIVPKKDVKEIFKKLQWLVDNRNKWGIFGKVGRLNIIKKYDINRLNKKLEKTFYESLKKK